MKKQIRMPEFKNEDEERKFWLEMNLRAARPRGIQRKNLIKDFPMVTAQQAGAELSS